MRNSERAFTLLEVMAAVMLLGIVYSLLATKSTEGIWTEGDARRRLEASLIADDVLSSLETEFALGTPPERTAQDEERGAFVVHTSVEDYRPPEPPVDPSAPTRQTTAEKLGLEVPDAFGSERGLTPSVLVQIGVRVTWQDLGVEKQVERTTWVFDRAAAAGLAGAAPELPGGLP